MSVSLKDEILDFIVSKLQLSNLFKRQDGEVVPDCCRDSLKTGYYLDKEKINSHDGVIDELD